MTDTNSAAVAEGQTRSALEAETIGAGSNPAGGTISDIEYITADLWSADRPHLPCGVRGWLVIGIGRKYVHLFSPASLESVRMPCDEYDALPGAQGRDFDPAGMIARIEAARGGRRKYGMFDGGRAADKALTLLREVKP